SEHVQVVGAQAQVLEQRDEMSLGEPPAQGGKEDGDPDRRVRRTAAEELTADVEGKMGGDAGGDGPERGKAEGERESEKREQEESAVRDAARAGDQRVGMAARPEQAVEERFVDEIGEQASQHEPARRKALAQTEEEPGADAEVAEDEQACTA